LKQITVTVNGRTHKLNCRENWTLLHLVRDILHLKGAKEVCGIGECGACTVIKDGKPVSSCCELAIRADNSKILTIEGVAVDGHLRPLQKAFIENSAFQCGFCTSGMIMMGTALLENTQNPEKLSEAQIRDYMSGNLCRCTGYQQIVDAIKQAASVPKLMEQR
jgi:aerobic carbon-monoxide dehydrogenase small subunit